MLPDLPYEAEHLWRHFQALSATRPSGMAAGPITYLEIDAFCRLSLVELSAWDVRLIRRVDDAVLAVIAKAKPEESAGAPKEIATTDAKGVKALFRGFGARRST